MQHAKKISLNVKHIAIGAGGLGFDSRAGQTGHSVGSLSLGRFFGAVFSRRQAAEVDAATLCTLQRNNASVMKI